MKSVVLRSALLNNVWLAHLWEDNSFRQIKCQTKVSGKSDGEWFVEFQNLLVIIGKIWS